MELHENIKALRTSRGWSQQHLADLAGYGDRSSIAKIESGKVDLPRSKIAEFAKIFGVTPAYLMGCDTPTETPLVEDYTIPNRSERRYVISYDPKHAETQKVSAAFCDYIASWIAKAEKCNKGLIELLHILNIPVQSLRDEFSKENVSDEVHNFMMFMDDESLIEYILRLERREPADRVYWPSRARKVELRKEKEEKGIDYDFYTIIEKVQKIDRSKYTDIIEYLNKIR